MNYANKTHAVVDLFAQQPVIIQREIVSAISVPKNSSRKAVRMLFYMWSTFIDLRYLPYMILAVLVLPEARLPLLRAFALLGDPVEED